MHHQSTALWCRVSNYPVPICNLWEQACLPLEVAGQCLIDQTTVVARFLASKLAKC